MTAKRKSAALFLAAVTAPTFRNIHFTKRDYETTNVVACIADVAPNANYEPCDESILVGLTPLWIERGVRYWGYL